jgi:hypothetical protein
MAKRLNPRHQESVRAKIQASHLVRILQQEAMGEKILRDGQRDSAKFLLNKSLANPPEDTNLNVSGGVDVNINLVPGRAEPCEPK